MLALVKKAELKQNYADKYKDKHPVQSDKVYSLMVPDCEQYPDDDDINIFVLIFAL